MSKRGIVTKLSGCLLSLAFWPAQEAAAGEIPALEIPFDWKGGYIVVRGSIGGCSELNLVIDTGASVTTISGRLAAKLSLRGRKKRVLAYGHEVLVEEVRLPSLEIGTLHLQDVPAWIRDQLSAPDARRTLRLDALIGLDLLRQTNLTIDFESRLLRFGSTDASAFHQPFYPGLPFLMLRMTVDGQPIRLMMDSGAEDLILYRRCVEDRLRMRKTGESKGIRHSGGQARLRKVRLTNVWMGDMEWAAVEAFLLDGPPPDSGLDGVLGIRALGWKQLALNFENQRISWTR